MKKLIVLVLLFSMIGCVKKHRDFEDLWYADRDEIKKRLDNLEAGKQDKIFIPNFPEMYHESTYICPICKKTFKRTNFSVKCLVYHGDNSCCHYGDEEIK